MALPFEAKFSKAQGGNAQLGIETPTSRPFASGSLRKQEGFLGDWKENFPAKAQRMGGPPRGLLIPEEQWPHPPTCTWESGVMFE